MRYNFLPIAGSTLGYQHYEETKALIGAPQKGNAHARGHVHSAETRTKFSGSNHGRAVGVIITDLQGTKLAEFPTRIEAAEWLGVRHQSVSCAIKRASIVKGMYRVFDMG